MTLIRVIRSWGDDFYWVEADEDAVQDAVDDLEEEYQIKTPEDEQDGDDKADYVISGLENIGFNLWIFVDEVNIDATGV